MGAERGLRQRIRTAIRAYDPTVLIVGQPANGMTGPGRHDLYVVVRGVYVGLEVKTSTGRATQIQLDRIRDTRRAGGWAWLVRTTHAAVWAIKFAGWGPPQKGHMSDDFDIDKLLASFRPDDARTPDDLDREIAGFKPSQALSEEHIASAAQANGTAAGDGEALGEAQTPMTALTQAIEGLTAAVRDLRITAEQLKTAQQRRAVPKGVEPPDELMVAEEEASGPGISAEELQALLSGPVDPPPPSEPSEPTAPPSKLRRRRAP